MKNLDEIILDHDVIHAANGNIKHIADRLIQIANLDIFEHDQLFIDDRGRSYLFQLESIINHLKRVRAQYQYYYDKLRETELENESEQENQKGYN